MKLNAKQKLRLGELLTFKRLITEIYPSGIVSIVSDTYDFWSCVNPDNGICATLKEDIMARDGKVVIRPDSGDPVKIVTGYTSDEIIVHQGKIYELDPNEKTGELKGKELT